MNAKILLLFSVLASSAAFGQEKEVPAPPGPYTDKDSGFVFPEMAEPFRRTSVYQETNPAALWVNYSAPRPVAKVSIRLILRRRETGPNGVPSCQEVKAKEREGVKHWPYARPFTDIKGPEFAGYTGAGSAEEFGPAKAGGTGWDMYFYCSRTTPWMLIFEFQRAKGIDARTQEIAFIRKVRPKGA